METKIYTEKRKYTKFDDNHYLLYLNETVIPNYVQEVREGEKELEPCTAYQYEGTEPDGGTMIEAKNDTYNDFVSGLIRKKYSADEVEAITLNKLSSNQERKEEFDAEFSLLEEYRNLCKEQVKKII
ncbi:hypothetical protein ACIXT9_02460 [Bacteroides fragilis]